MTTAPMTTLPYTPLTVLAYRHAVDGMIEDGLCDPEAIRTQIEAMREDDVSDLRHHMRNGGAVGTKDMSAACLLADLGLPWDLALRAGPAVLTLLRVIGAGLQESGTTV